MPLILADFTTDGNMTTAGNYIGGAEPTTGEDLSVAGTSRTINGLDYTAGGAGAALGTVTVHNTCTGSIGKDDQYLMLDLDDLEYDGRGALVFLDLDVTNKVVINGSGSGTVTLDSHGIGAGIHDVEVRGAANVDVAAGAEMGFFRRYADGLSVIGAGVTKSDAADAVLLYAGTTSLGASFPMEINAGAKGIATDSAQPATVLVTSGGTFEDLSDAVLASIEIEPGARLITRNNPTKKTNTLLVWHKGAFADVFDPGVEVGYGTITYVGWEGPAA